MQTGGREGKKDQFLMKNDRILEIRLLKGEIRVRLREKIKGNDKRIM